MEKAVDNRLAELERRIAALESAALSTTPEAPTRSAGKEGVGGAGGGGAGGAQGTGAGGAGSAQRAGVGGADAAQRVAAEAERALEGLRERDDWAGLAGGLAALGNPVRLTLLREIVRGRATVSALSEVDGLETSGQIYHHLRQLTAEGWLHSPSRGAFAVPPARVVALLAILEALQN
ncbi:ArsR family transcriptional regulator [Kribbella sp. CA-294648]|uniref:ArsR family transcriptional regulator n=1 Tax=Kribbella sp. CA-294648 TaxID=3239948 RepID=UPI003D8D993E